MPPPFRADATDVRQTAVACFGDGRDFNVAVITLEPVAARCFAGDRGATASSVGELGSIPARPSGRAWSEFPTAGAQDDDAARLFARSGIVAQLDRPSFPSRAAHRGIKVGNTPL